MDPIAAPFEKDFGVIADQIRAHAKRDPQHLAVVDKTASVTYAQLDAMMDRVAAALKRDGVKPQQAIAICAYSSVHYAAIFLGALRAGVVVAPLAPGSTPEQLKGMLTDADAKILFTEEATAEAVNAAEALGIPRVSLDGSAVGRQLVDWVAPFGTRFKEVKPQPDWAFNIIYSSGTTGTPKGIVQPHKMRWAHVRRGGGAYQYGPGGVTVLATPLYSNTTLVVFFPTLAWGGTVVLMPKFDAKGYLELAQKHHATHTMLVPVQYSRIMAVPEFDSFDLSSFKFKFCTSAPFGAALKADILKRWPGGLVEFYGMTEGGGSCILEAHLYPNKLHTVGKPAEGHDIRLIDEHGKVVPQGEMGEVVGRSVSMMTGYHQQPEKTRDAEWHSPEGERFIRTGDVGRFDEDGFLTLMDRKKDMIISGGFNIYPSDLEAVMRQHAAVADVAVVGVPSEAWGETPVAYVVKKPGEPITEQALQDWFAHQVGKTQRVSAVHYIDELPRSAIGKVLKRELRDRHVAESKPHIVA
ncbi:acyl--CoA ligase [Rhizobacter sp. J219]|uniref:class I adenylate-forming enzyme family protein n=1 Tax=Rhizobacter sp. J219 TaxID=2898430 RepID=UPI002150748D|nr:class I adenylate-forming enzyme family protein [Rhizobacter sp. J219]MCR5883864.1 acyl--CoA ligase [Rhizobacter sp. J219]